MVRDQEVDFENVQGVAEHDGGVEHGRLLADFSEAVMLDDGPRIEAVRSELEAAIGAAGIVDTAAVIAMFNVVDRVADATGIPLDESSEEFRTAVGQELGMMDMSPEARSAR